MQQTTNYNLLIPEGTDVVNPLTQVNPNFQTIDGAMFANKQATIGTASEVVTGTVHAVIRNNPDSDVFRFTATGAWTAGDTMTLDGQQVTVHLSDGTTPATNSYIIGAEVLAMVNGSLVTLAISSTPPAQGVISFNSRTGAVVPAASDYDGSMIDYDNTTSGLNATDVQGAIDEIEDQIQNLPTASGPFTVLWENPNITGVFNPQTITLPSGDYDAVKIYFDTGNNTSGQCCEILKGMSGALYNMYVSSSSGNSQVQARIATVSADGLSITFDDAYRTYILQDSASLNNGFCKPRKIVGVKFS